MKRTLLPLLTASGLALSLSHTVSASEKLGSGFSLSSNVAITSNYVFRGVNESDEEPSVQGGFDLEHESGAYLGTWAASVAGYGGGGVELDYFAGYGLDLSASLWADIGGYYYGYPGADGEPNTQELYAGLGTSLGDIEGDFYAHVSDDYFDSDESSTYLETNWSAPLTAGFYANAHFGYLLHEPSNDPYDFLVGAGYALDSLDLSLAYTYWDNDEADENYISFTVARSF